MERFKYPPCQVNIFTEKPYVRHKWEVAYGKDGKPLLRRGQDESLYYHIYCTRCGFNDPKKERF